MPSETDRLLSTRPVTELVARNRFRSARYQPQGMIAFQDARPLLPAPVLPHRPVWEEMYWRAWELAWHNLRSPHSGSDFVASYIGPGDGDRLDLWESAFIALFAVYGRRAFYFPGGLDNFYSRQHNDGFISQRLNAGDGSDCFYPYDPNGAGPNVLAWVEWRIFRHTRDQKRIEQVFWPLLALHEWYRQHRTWPSHLYWATGLSCGMSDQPRIPDGARHHQHWTWVDANMQASLNCRMLMQMGNLLGEEGWAGRLSEEHAFLLREVNGRLWNEATQFYHDVDPNGKFSLLRSIGAYWGLLDRDLVPAERLLNFLGPLWEQDRFDRPHRVPTLPADSPAYDPQAANAWCGGVWSPTNYMLLKGLRQHDRHRAAHAIAVNHLENLAEVFQHTDTFWEYYAPEEAAPGQGARGDYVGWTGLSPISILLEDVIGISVDWPLRRVTWDRRLETAAVYGVRNYPLGADGTVDLLGDNRLVEVVSDVPFTLTIRTPEETVQTAIPAGANTINLA